MIATAPVRGPRALIDLKGLRFGKLLVLRRGLEWDRPGATAWIVRCDCGREEVRYSHSLRGVGLSRGCRPSFACRPCIRAVRRAEQRAGTDSPITAPSRLVPGAVLGVCSWCQRPAGSVTKARSGRPCECVTCERAACRNGRDATGRPIRKIGKMRTP